MADFMTFLWNQSARAVWLILAVLVVRRLLSKAPKSFRMVLWTLVAFQLICPIAMQSPWSLVPAQQMKEPVTEVIISENFFALDEIPISEASKEDDSYKIYEAVTPRQDWREAAGVVWIAGVAVMAAYSAASLLRVKRKTAVRILREKGVWLCDNINTPFVIGILRPQVYLPSHLSEEEAEYVLLHERVHLKRKDPLWKMLGFLLLTVYWFHPLVWISFWLFSKDMELACDEAVIRSMQLETRKEYSKVLLNLSTPQHQMLGCPLAFGELGVKERIGLILNYKRPGFWVMIAAVVLTFLIAVCFMTERKEEVLVNGAVKERLAGYSADLDELIERGCFVNGQNESYCSHIWYKFQTNVNQKIPAEIVIVYLLEDGRAAYDYISYNGESYYLMNRSSDNTYREYEFQYLEVFEYSKIPEKGYLLNLVFSDIKDLTAEQLKELSVSGEDGTFYVLPITVEQPEVPELKEDADRQEITYSYDMSKDLIEREKIAGIEVVNAWTGEWHRYEVTDSSHGFRELLELYHNLNAMPDDTMELRIGGQYYMQILDENGEELQRVTPYKDAVKIDGRMYECSKNGTSTQLYLKLDSLMTSDYGNLYGKVLIDLKEKEQQYALIDLGLRYHVLCATDRTYDDDNGHNAALYCDVYYIINSVPVKIGTLESMGTAYPLSYGIPGCFYVDSGNSREVYIVDTENGKLILSEKVEVIYDENGEESYQYTTDGNQVKNISKEEYEKLRNAVAGTVISFKY